MEHGSTERTLEVRNTQVFDYSQELIVELHGRTPDGEFDVVSYAFRANPDGDGGLQAPEIQAVHEDHVEEALAETDYSLA